MSPHYFLQHFPLFRVSDSACSEPDEAPTAEREVLFREKWDCLSEEATEMASAEMEMTFFRAKF